MISVFFSIIWQMFKHHTSVCKQENIALCGSLLANSLHYLKNMFANSFNFHRFAFKCCRCEAAFILDFFLSKLEVAGREKRKEKTPAHSILFVFCVTIQSVDIMKNHNTMSCLPWSWTIIYTCCYGEHHILCQDRHENLWYTCMLLLNEVLRFSVNKETQLHVFSF